jgi:hypothetical protein
MGTLSMSSEARIRSGNQIMHRLLHIAALSTALLAGMGAAAHATAYNEATNGDLSDLSSQPTNIGTLTPGNNSVIGSSIPSGAPIPDGHGALAVQDNDFFTFNVPTGYVLSQFDIVDDITTDDRFFLGIYPGTQASVDPSNPTPAGLLGYTLPGTALPSLANPNGPNFLPDIAASDEPGFPTLTNHFPGVLGAGAYTVWLVDGDQPLHYELDLGISAVPEPSMWMLMMAGVGLLGAALRRRAPRAVQASIS